MICSTRRIGSPPRLRETHKGEGKQMGVNGITPACGNTALPRSASLGVGITRACGNTVVQGGPGPGAEDHPPARNTCPAVSGDCVRQGSPAPAETRIEEECGEKRKRITRACGKHIQRKGGQLICAGSPPPAKHIHLYRVTRWVQGSPRACGNTFKGLVSVTSGRDHPAPAETLALFYRQPSLGSPPRLRNTQVFFHVCLDL